MSKTQATSTTELATLAGTEVTFIMPTTEELGTLKDLKDNFSLTLKYKRQDEWVKDEEIRAFYLGLKQVPNEDGEMVTCGVFATEKECFISAPILLVEAVQSLPCKTPVSITYRGKKKNTTSAGFTNLFDVITLG